MRDDASRSARIGRRRLISHKSLGKRVHLPLTDHWRPTTRADCRTMERPCPYVGCKYHLYLTVLRTGSIAIQLDVEPWELAETCVLDVAERGGVSQDVAARAMNLTRHGLQLIEWRVMDRIGGNGEQ